MSADSRQRPLIVTDGIGGAHRTMSDGYGYFLRRWSTQGAPRATLVFLHGMGAHSGWFAQLGAALAAEGVASYAFDLPGHGFTDGARGDLASFARIGLVLEDTLRLAQREHRDTPLFLGGLSLGGILALREAMRRSGDATFSGYIALSPPILDTFIPPLDKLRMFARLPFAPTAKAKCPLGYGTRIVVDAAAQRCAEADRLGLREVTLRTYWHTLAAIVALARGGGRIDAPVLMMIGAQDRVGSPASMRWMAKRIGANATVREYADLGHDLKIEPHPERLAHDIGEWLAAHVAAPHAA